MEVVTRSIGIPSKRLHESSRVSMATPHLPHLAAGLGGVAVVAHERGKIEGGGEPRLALLEEHVPAGVRVLRAPHAGEHAEGPDAAPVTGGLVAAEEGKFSRDADVPGEIHLRDVFGGVEPLDFQVGDGGPAGVVVRPPSRRTAAPPLPTFR